MRVRVGRVSNMELVVEFSSCRFIEWSVSMRTHRVGSLNVSPQGNE